MLKAKVLYEALLNHDRVEKSDLDKVFESLPRNANVPQFRNAIVDAGLMSYTDVMTFFVEKELLVQGKGLIEKVQTERNSKTHFKPTTHEHKYHITENDTFNSTICLEDGELSIVLPKPNLSRLHFEHSDEKQAVTLAMDLALMGEVGEAEQILLETLESFPDSVSGVATLSWMYLATGHGDRAEHWAEYGLKVSRNNISLIEMLSLAEQIQKKHLLATGYYQRLLRLKRIKPLWYLLLAYSLEKANCGDEAIANYKTYTKISDEDELIEFAQQHIEKIDAA